MKNLYILPTNKPSRLVKIYNDVNRETFTLKLDVEVNDSFKEYVNIYITSDEEITGFENDVWVYNNGRVWFWQNTMALRSNNKPKKIILTTDQDLIKDGVQEIDDEFLEWFVENPNCEEVEVEKYSHELESKREALEEAAKKWVFEINGNKWSNNDNTAGDNYGSFITGAKWQQKQDENLYSEEDLREAFRQGEQNISYSETYGLDSNLTEQQWFEQFKK